MTLGHITKAEMIDTVLGKRRIKILYYSEVQILLLYDI